jgi:hypothetical protein
VHPSEELVRRAYAAQAGGDVDAYVGLLSDDFVLHIPGQSRIAGLIGAEAERDGTTVLLPRVHVCHVRDDALAELWLIPADQYAFDEFWG